MTGPRARTARLVAGGLAAPVGLGVEARSAQPYPPAQAKKAHGTSEQLPSAPTSGSGAWLEMSIQGFGFRGLGFRSLGFRG